MDYQTSSASLSQKLSTGHSVYDGVFSSAPSKLTVSSFSSTLQDYREIFGAAAASSIPVLEVPELNEQKSSVDVRSSKLDYSNVFGGFADSDFAVPYDELIAEPKKKTKLQKQSRRQAERVSPPKEAKRSCSEENIDLGNEGVYESIDGVKKFSMSYNRSNNRSKSFAGVHSVPAYTCLVDETSPSRATEGGRDQSVSMSSVAKERRMEGNRSAKAMREQPAGDAGKQASGGGGVRAENDSNWQSSIDELFKSGQGTHPSSKPPLPSQVSKVDKPVSLGANGACIVNSVERNMGGNPQMKAAGDQPASDESKQTSAGVSKVQRNSKSRSSGSIDKLFYSGEIAQETRPSDVPPFSSKRFDGKGEFEESVASMFGGLNHDAFKGADSVSSPPYFDEEVDTNSVAAASVAALTKAIEEAQASIQLAKELMDRKKVGPQSRVKLSFDNSMKPKSRKVSKSAGKASISKETKTRELYEKVDIAHVSATPACKSASTIRDVMFTGEKIRGKEIIDDASTFTKKKTHELQEEVHVSALPEQVTVALADTDKLCGVEARGKVREQEFEPVPTDHKHEEADDSEAAEQYYEFADTSEPDVSEGAEQFYEFADSSEPDVSEATEDFYEFADSNAHHDILLENQEANNTRQMFRSVDDDEQEKKTDMEALENLEQVGKTSKAAEANNTRQMFQSVDEDEQEKKMDGKESKAATAEVQKAAEATNTRQIFRSVDEDEQEKNTDREAFENPELVGNTLKAATEEEQRQVENIFNAVEDASEFEENDDLASPQECSNQEDNEKPQETTTDHDKIGKFKTTRAKETCEEKQDGDEKRYEPQELQETEPVKIESVVQEWVENEKIDRDGCMLEQNDMEQTCAQSKEDTDRNLTEDKEEISETVYSFHEEGFEKRHEDDSMSEGGENLQDTRPNQKILEEATCQECQNRQEESFEFVDAGRMKIQMDESTESEKVRATQEEKILDCNFEAADNQKEQSVHDDLDSKQGSARDIECNQDVEDTLELPINTEDRGGKEVAETSVQLEENKHQTELVEEESDVVEKDTCETDCSTPGVQLPERSKQMKDALGIHSDENEIRTSESDMSFVQKQDDHLAGEPSVDYNADSQVEECKESGDINSDMMSAEVGVTQERNKNVSKSRKRWFGTNDVSGTFIKLEEDGNQSELVEEEDVVEEKVICEIEGLASGVKLTEILKQMEDVIELHSSDTNGASVYGQMQDAKLARESEVSCNLQKHDKECRDINKGMMQPEVAAVNPEENVNSTKSSHRKRWFDNGKDTKVAQAPHIFGRKAGSVLLDIDVDTSLFTKRDEVNEDGQQATMRPKESETFPSSLKELEQENNANPQTSAAESETDHNSQGVEEKSRSTLRAKENETNFTSQIEVEGERESQQEPQTANEFEISASSQKVLEPENEQLIRKAERRRERERQKEKKAVAQVIREARERSFAETRQKVMAEAQGRLGKTPLQANDTSLTEKASKEAKAKQKWERAAVERATTEARDRALEKALSEKVAAEAGKQAKRSVPEKYAGASTDGMQAKRSVSEKFAGVSRDNGLSRSLDLESKGSFSSSTARSPNSSYQPDPSPAEQSNGTNGESAQRCKARLEMNQRTAERAAKALAEKNNRDLLVQQEQAERNRLAEVLDAEVKRWSSGKERNLRALLSSLQYILGPDSGWQPVHLTDIVTAVAVKKAYRKAALFVHPDKLQQRGASIQQKYTCEKVFDLLKDAWNRFSMDER
ncbi:auxilin-like protein 1 [Argentina anserina]|uniref:auxilin-like protein 1 n=1 Tax=Argentina anserina TaxID=57926 RepID=UPI0021768C16|nr:auxilin-like protein 1 [Potentilla anserina]